MMLFTASFLSRRKEEDFKGKAETLDSTLLRQLDVLSNHRGFLEREHSKDLCKKAVDTDATFSYSVDMRYGPNYSPLKKYVLNIN
jgi:hypothetical protein